MLILTPPAQAGEPCPPGLLSGFGGQTRHIEIRDNIAYVAAGKGGMHVVDISVPNHPALMGSLPLDNDATDIALVGSTAYVANAGSGFEIVSIANPARPLNMGSLPSFGAPVSSIETIDDQTICSARDDLIQIFDVSNPRAPQPVAELDTFRVRDLFASGGLLYTLQSFSRLEIIDVSDTKSIRTLSTTTLPISAYSITVVGMTAYCSSPDGELVTIDVANPEAPTVLTSARGKNATNARGDQDAAGIAVSNAIAFVASASRGLELFDVSDPANPGDPRRLFSDPASGVAVAGDVAYLAALDSGFNAIDPTADPAEAVLATISIPGDARRLLIKGELAFIADGPGGPLVLDVSDPAAIRPLASVSNWNPDLEAFSVEPEGNFLFVSTGLGSTIEIVEVVDPVNPKVVASLSLPGSPRAVLTAGDTMYVGCDDLGLCVVDITDPALPKIISTQAPKDAIFDMAMSDTTLYLARGTLGVTMLDVTDPRSPSVIGELALPLGSASRLAINNNALFVIAGGNTGGVQIFDLTQPSGPTLQSTFEQRRIFSVSFLDQEMYITTIDNTRLLKLSIADTAAPKLLQTNLLGRTGFDSATSEGLLFIAAGDEGLVIVAPELCSADVGGDGDVDAGDLAFVIGRWGDALPRADVDGDGIVGAGDLAAVLAAWGTHVDRLR